MNGTVIHKGENCNFVQTLSPIKTALKNEAKQTMFFNKPIHIITANAVVGNKEGKGPLKNYFKSVKDDIKLG